MFKSILALALLCAVPAISIAQNFNISYKNPDNLVVCSNDTLSITIQNSTAVSVSGALLDLELPTGLEYLSGSVSGALESDISNLEKPIFSLPELLPSQSLTLRVQLTATCDLVDAINSAQLFSALLRVRDGATTEQVITTKFQIQTSLLVITQVDNSALAGEKSQTFTRTLHIRNTRLGPMRHLFLLDAHPAGISIQVNGATAQQDQPELYTAYFDGAFFTQFGDGDTLLEFGETALVQQEITITDCGIPSYNCRSNIAASWSCTATDPPCQGDSTIADVLIKPSTFQPNLVFETEYALPWDQCAQRPHEMRMRVINVGNAPATNIILQINSEAPAALGMDKTSFKMKRAGQTTPLPPNLVTNHLMEECGLTKAGFVTLVIPEMQAQDTAYISFDAFYCLPACKQRLPLLRMNYYYNKPCPVGGFVVSDTVAFSPHLFDYLSGVALFNIGKCLQDDENYPFSFKFTSNRLLADSGYLWLKLDLPYGLELSSDCPFVLDGKTPVKISSDTLTTDYLITRVFIAFELPMSDTSALASFCLKNNCSFDNSYVWTGAGIPNSGDDFFIYVPGDCSGCGYAPEMTGLLSLNLDDNLDCAVQACDSFELRTACPCPPDIVPPSPDDCPDCPCNPQNPGCCILQEKYEAYRLNYDLADNNDDQRPDPNGVLDMNKVRRDRFLPGDTLRNLLSTKIICGDSIDRLFYQLFAEVIASDYGYASVFDTFAIGPTLHDPARSGFTDSAKIQIADAELTIWDASTNTVYSCPMSTIFPRDQLYGRVTPVNTKPPTIIDQIATMNYPFYPRMSDLSDLGCLPDGFLVETGDSIQLRVDLKFKMNYAPPSNNHYPPLVNFEMGYNSNNLYRWYNYRHYDTLMFQYSGYVDSLTPATFGIKPCETSAQVTPFAYNIRIARENLFPYEVRPLSKIVNYDLIMPPGLSPLSAELLFLNLQTNIPLQQNLNLPISVIPDSMLRVDFSPAYQIPVDEGYALRARIPFAPSCLFTMPDSSSQFTTLDFPGCMRTPDSVTHLIERKIGFYSNHPRDTITALEAIFNFPTADVSAEVLLQNQAPIAAPNMWIYLANPEGALADLKITVLSTGAVINPVNGLYQLGTLPILGKRNLKITGVNNSCDEQTLLVIYGWDCQPYLVPGGPSCGTPDTLELLFRPRKPEIELELVDFPANVPLCDTSDYFIFELSNADLGYAYLPFLNIELPPGLELVPGSCQMAYPLGSAFTAIPDPVDVGNNLLEWNLAALQDSIAANGLPGVNLDPENALQIRFKVLAGCGAVSNAQLIFGARAAWSCGKPTNTLRKASDPILVEGLEPSYDVQVNVTDLSGSNPAPCASVRSISVNMQVSGPALPGDSIYIDLPPGYTFVPGSYVPGLNAPSGQPQLSPGVLRWPMPAGLPANTTIQFTFKITTPDELNCEGAYLRVQTRQQLQAFCEAIGGDCSVYVATGEASHYFPPTVTKLALTGASLHVMANGKVNYLVSISNASNTQGQSVNVIQFFYDTDHNGQFGAADVLLYTIGNLNLFIPPGETIQVPLNGLPAPDSLCHLLVVLPALKNCLCPVNTVLVLSNTVSYASIPLCPGQSTPLGVAEMAGHLYSWSGAANLPCTDCPGFVYAPPAPGMHSLTLVDQGATCQVTHNYLVEVFDAPVLQVSNSTICRGQSAILQTSPALTWNWQGPGIVDPAAPNQTVVPLQNSLYFVTATNAEGCTLTDSVLMTVLALDTLDLGLLFTCEGTPVDVFGTPTATSGLYSQVLTNAGGCDSLLFLTLEVVPNTEESIQRCPSDTVLVFGVAVAQAGTYCDTIPSSIGCDSIHCIVVTDFPVPELPDPDTFYFEQGGSVQLPGPGGYQNYQWTPGDYLDCTNCQSPVASPPDTMEYTLTLQTTDGCPDTLIYRVVPLPPCDPARIRVPNAFTPDEDGYNDVFAPLPIEGSEVITRLIIYNRWGQKVYEASGPNARWDGTTFGKPAPSDVYVWLLEVLCDGDGKAFRKGNVTVLR